MNVTELTIEIILSLSKDKAIYFSMEGLVVMTWFSLVWFGLVGSLGWSLVGCGMVDNILGPLSLK